MVKRGQTLTRVIMGIRLILDELAIYSKQISSAVPTFAGTKENEFPRRLQPLPLNFKRNRTLNIPYPC